MQDNTLLGYVLTKNYGMQGSWVFSSILIYGLALVAPCSSSTNSVAKYT
jgi:hypothetical protein